MLSNINIEMLTEVYRTICSNNCSLFVQENRQREILEEKRRKREEAKRAAEEARRKKGQKAKAVTEVPEEDTNIVDNLLKEIRAGTTLRRTGHGKRHSRPPTLNAEELQKLKKIAEQATTSPRSRKSSSTTSPHNRNPSSPTALPEFTFPEESANLMDRIVEEAARQIAEEATQKAAAVQASQDALLPSAAPPTQTATPITPPIQTATSAIPPAQTFAPPTPPTQTSTPAAPLVQPPQPATPPVQPSQPTTPPVQPSQPATPPVQPSQPAVPVNVHDESPPVHPPHSEAIVPVATPPVPQNGGLQPTGAADSPRATEHSGELEAADDLHTVEAPSGTITDNSMMNGEGGLGRENGEGDEEPRMKVPVVVHNGEAQDEELLQNGPPSSPARQVRQNCNH